MFSALADGYATTNFNHPASNLNQILNFNFSWGDPNINLAKFTIDKSDSVLGIHVDMGLGKTMRWYNAFDPASQEHKALRYFEQMYVIVKPKNAHGMEIDYGQFGTWVGAEPTESHLNFNYSRSLLFSWSDPYYHFGLRTLIPVTKSFTAGVQLVNAWNTIQGNHDMKNVGFTAMFTQPKFGWNNSYYVGNNHVDNSPGVRHIYNTVITLNPTEKSSTYIEYDYARDNHVGGYDSWYGIAGASRYQITKMFSFAGRAEWFKDANGFSTGKKQRLKEFTATLEYKYNSHLISRVEYRRDSSDIPFFDRGAQTARVKSQGTLTLGIMAILGPLK